MMRAAIGGICALFAVLGGVLVLVSSAESEATTTPVVLAPHGGSPTIYAGPGDRAQLDGLWRFRGDPKAKGLDRNYQAGKFGGELVRLPYVPDATKISGRRGIPYYRGKVVWYRTKLDVPTDGSYAIRFESVNHKADVFIDGKRVGKHTGEYLPFEVKAALKAGSDILFDIDWQGTQQLHSAMGEDLVRIFLLPPSMAELERRLRTRGTDSADVIASRMERAAGEISHWAEYDYVLVNDDTASCLAEVRAIVAAERLKRARQAGLVTFVRDLVSGAVG